MSRPDKLALRILENPDDFPPEFKAWVVRAVQASPNFQIAQASLPNVEPRRYVGAQGQPAFEHSWVNFGGADESVGFYKDPFQRVYLLGVAKTGTVTASIFTLPSGYRPKATEVFAVSSNGAFGSVTIATDGTVTASVGSNTSFSLSGISFRAFM